MDVAHLLKNVIDCGGPIIEQLWGAFIDEKTDECIKQYENRDVTHLKRNEDAPNLDVKTFSPEKIIWNYGTLCCVMAQLPETDFVQCINGAKNLKVGGGTHYKEHWSPNYQFMLFIDKQMPSWRQEFMLLKNTFSDEIHIAERMHMEYLLKDIQHIHGDELVYSRELLDLVLNKIRDYLVFERLQVGGRSDLIDELLGEVKKGNLKLGNSNSWKKDSHGYCFAFQNFEFEVRKIPNAFFYFSNNKEFIINKKLSFEKLKIIDELFPVWQKEVDSIKMETHKKSRIDALMEMVEKVREL